MTKFIIILFMLMSAPVIAQDRCDFNMEETDFSEESDLLTIDGNPVNGNICVYHDNGNISMLLPVKEGAREGIVTLYNKNGQTVSEVTFKNNKAEGITKVYYENGNIKSESICKNGKIEKIKTYSVTGKLLKSY